MKIRQKIFFKQPYCSAQNCKCKNGEVVETVTEDITVPDIYEREVTHFSNCVLNNLEPSVPGEEGLKNQIVLDTAMMV